MEDPAAGSNETSDLLKRMMQLKEMYKNIKTQTTPTLVAAPPKKPAAKEEESESEEGEPSKKAPAARVYVKKANDNVDLAQLQAVMKQVILDNGGSAHIDTISEYMKIRWPNLRKKDGSLFNTLDCKRLLQSNMKQLKVAFERDHYHEGCYTLREADKEGEEESEDSHDFELEDEEADKSETQANMIANAIDGSNGGATYDEICAYLTDHWQTKPRRSDEELRESVKIALTTNPRFRKEIRRTGQEVWLIQARNKRKSAQNAQIIQEVAAASKADVGKRRRKPEEDEMSNGEASDDETRRGRGRGRGGRGGRFIPGQAVPLGSFNRNKLKEVKEVKDVNPWICCDGCGKWVQAKQDGIEDISIYDDANPNHLDYYCPKCRKKREDEGLLQPDLKPLVLQQQAQQQQQQAAPSQARPPQSISEADSAGVATRRAKRQQKDDDESADVAAKPSSGASASALLGGLHNNNNAQNNNPRKSARGARPRKKFDDDDDDDKSKLDQVERDCLEQFEAERADDSALSADKLERVRLLEKKFEEELSKYKQTLVTSRDAIFEKNQKDFDAQVEKLEREKDALDQKAEEELALQLRDFADKRRGKLKTMVAEITGDDR